MGLGFNNPIGLAALLLIIPLIILYLIRPKPKKLEIPSLMFINKTYQKIKQYSFLRRILRDLLFLLQLLILLFLLLTVSEPWFEVSEDTIKDHSTIVLDVSASMNTIEGTTTRFELAREKAINYLGQKNTIILVQNKPIIALKDVSKSQAKKLLENIKSGDTESNIGDAMVLAGEITPDAGKVIVISDFINTQGTQPLTAKEVLESKNIPIKLINVGSTGKKNFAIIDANIEEDITKIFLKNYNKDKDKLKLQINDKAYELDVEGNSIESYSFNTQKGITKVSINNEDDMPEDNVAFISVPEDNTINVLLVTNIKSKFLESAVTSAEDINLEVAEPPILPKKDYDVYIFYGIQPENILAGTFEELLKKVENGETSVIVHAQKDIQKIDYGALMPVKIKSLIKNTAVFQPDQLVLFTKEINFGQSSSFFAAEARKGVKTLVSYDNNPIIAMIQLNKGYLLYYGILEDESDFKLSPEYPIFWTKMLRYLSNKKQIKDLNLRTGASLSSVREEIILDQIGTYNLGKSTLALNLFNEQESNINIEQTAERKIEKFTLDKIKEKVKKDITEMILWLALLILIGELLYSKWRGEF